MQTTNVRAAAVPALLGGRLTRRGATAAAATARAARRAVTLQVTGLAA
jgi:hypothetical protein